MASKVALSMSIVMVVTSVSGYNLHVLIIFPGGCVMRPYRPFALVSAAAWSLVIVISPTVIRAQDPAAPVSAKTWIGREAELEDYLRSAEITKCEATTAGVTHPRKCALKPGGPAEFLALKIFPPGTQFEGIRESYKAEIAAYEINKLIHLDMVPPTVEKTYKGEKGVAIMWASPTKSWAEFGGQKAPVPPAPYLVPYSIMIAKATMYDDLIGDPDPNFGNWLVDPAWNLILIDHSRALTSDTSLLQPLRHVEPVLWDQMKALTIESLTAAVGKWLDKGDIKAIIQRRDKMQKSIDDLIKKYGADNVFIKSA